MLLAPTIGAAGFVTGFSGGDVIQVLGETPTSVTETRAGSDTILKAYAGTALEDTFQVGGHIASGAIGISSDGSGGSIRHFRPVTTTGLMSAHTA